MSIVPSAYPSVGPSVRRSISPKNAHFPLVSCFCVMHTTAPAQPSATIFSLTLFVPSHYSVNVIAKSSRTTTPLRGNTKRNTSPNFGMAKQRRRTFPWRHHLTNLSGNTLHSFNCQSHLHIAVSSLSTFL